MTVIEHPTNTGVVHPGIPASSRNGPTNFWLVPLATGSSSFAVSVVDVFPIKLWDRHSHQFKWTTLPNYQDLDFEARPFIAGTARISLSSVRTEAKRGSQDGDTAVVLFGLWLSKPVTATDSRPRTPDYSINPPWCRLLKDEGDSSLDLHSSTAITIQDAQQHSSLPLGGGIVLHASAVRTQVSMETFDLVKIWTTEQGTDEGADVVMALESPAAQNQESDPPS